MDFLYTLNFIAFIVYNILSGTLFDKNNSLWYWLYCVGLFVSLMILAFVVKRNGG